MKMIIVPSIMLPMPPVMGGAVQNLIQMYLDDNEVTGNAQIVVYSYFNDAAAAEAKKYKHTSYRYIQNLELMEELQHKSIKFLSGTAFHIREYVYVKEIVKSIRAEENGNFDLILLENCPQFALRFRECFPDKTIYTHLHNDYVNDSKKSSTNVVRTTDKFICVSNYISERVKTIASDNKVVTVLNGVKIDKTGKRNNELRKRLGIREKDFVVIFTGRLVKEKGAHILIEAISKIQNREHIKVLFLGSKLYGQDISDDYLNNLQKMASPYKDNVVFTGFVPYGEIGDYYEIADVGILLSQWDDPCPLTVIEYLTFGLPVITTKSGGIPEIVDENCAFVFERNNSLADNAANAIQLLQNDRDLLNKMSKASQRRSELFTMKMYLNRMKREIER